MSRAQIAIAGETPDTEITFRRNPLIDVLVLAVTFIVWIFLIFPAVWIFISSFKTKETMFAATTFSFTLENYQTIFRAGFGRFIFNSLFICLVAVVISTFISVIASYVLSRKRFRAKRVIFGAVILGQLFPWIILVTPLFIMFAKIGLLNSYTGMILSYVAISIPSPSTCLSAIWRPFQGSSTKPPSWTVVPSSRSSGRSSFPSCCQASSPP